MDCSGVEILDHSSRADMFIDKKIKERSSTGSEVPFFVADLDDVCEKHLRWRTLLPRVQPFYAVKCNDTAAVLRTLDALGTGFDCASKNELERVLALGVSPDRIIYAHTLKPQSHLRYARAAGVDLMTFDCKEELHKICTWHPKAKLVLRISVDDSKSRVKLSTKFGAEVGSVDALLTRARELHLDVCGVSFHVGSFCTDSGQYRKAITDARLVFDRAISSGVQMNLLDLGGGFIGREEFQTVSEEINRALWELFPADSGVRIIAEPGRYFVNSAFTLAVNVFATKKVLKDPVDQTLRDGTSAGPVKIYFVTDGLYGAFGDFRYSSRFKLCLRPHRRVASGELRFQSVLWGPTCNAMDRIQDVLLPKLQVGDWILVDNMGAYTVPMCTPFNGFDHAPVYSVVSAPTWRTLKAHLEHVKGPPGAR